MDFKKIKETNIIPSQSLEGKLIIEGLIVNIKFNLIRKYDRTLISGYVLSLSGIPYFIESLKLSEKDFVQLKKFYDVKYESDLIRRQILIAYRIERGKPSPGFVPPKYVPTGVMLK